MRFCSQSEYWLPSRRKCLITSLLVCGCINKSKSVFADTPPYIRACARGRGEQCSMRHLLPYRPCGLKTSLLVCGCITKSKSACRTSGQKVILWIEKCKTFVLIIVNSHNFNSTPFLYICIGFNDYFEISRFVRLFETAKIEISFLWRPVFIPIKMDVVFVQ